MKVFFMAMLFSILFPAATNAQTAPEIGSKRGQEVIATIAKWAESVRDRDVKALDTIFDDEVIITLWDGKTRGKAEELNAFKPNPNIKYASVANEDVAIKLFGDVSVVTGLTKMRIVTSGREARVALRYTAVLVKKEGLWRIVALQTARAPGA
jgi:ketosteroid isomerase-like protein